MSSSEPMREFFETVAVAARAARETLVQRTIEQHAPRARVREMESLFKSAFAATHFGNTGTQFLLAMAARGGRRRSLQLLEAALRIAARMGGVALRARRVFRGIPLLGIPIGAGVNAMLL